MLTRWRVLGKRFNNFFACFIFIVRRSFYPLTSCYYCPLLFFRFLQTTSCSCRSVLPSLMATESVIILRRTKSFLECLLSTATPRPTPATLQPIYREAWMKCGSWLQLLNSSGSSLNQRNNTAWQLSQVYWHLPINNPVLLV